MYLFISLFMLGTVPQFYAVRRWRLTAQPRFQLRMSPDVRGR